MMSEPQTPLANSLFKMTDPQATVTVTLSYELVTLLSTQLYQSPLKAIEELVVNSYDADARECRVFVPVPYDRDHPFVAVFDDGAGMDQDGLQDLWHIGRSKKRSDLIQKLRSRKQIGKFGIGKLATYALADQVTYVTRQNNEIHMVSLNFEAFKPTADGRVEPVVLGVRRISDWNKLASLPLFASACQSVGIDPSILFGSQTTSWTFAILEALKEPDRIQQGRLRWILSTAMPLHSDFSLYLNGSKTLSSKLDYKTVTYFNVKDLPAERLRALGSSTGEEWSVSGDSLKSASFPAGISGTVLVTERPLFSGKSDDLGRSHGFFIRVLGRLINLDNALFNLTAVNFTTWYRFRADIIADDLDADLKAHREDIEFSDRKVKLQALLLTLYNEARSRYSAIAGDFRQTQQTKKEHDRDYVDPALVELPLADVLSHPEVQRQGAEADNSWFYLRLGMNDDFQQIANLLYSSSRTKYNYTFINSGKSNRIVEFDPRSNTFYMNSDHDFVLAHGSGGSNRLLLEDMVTAEALLEVYMREHGVLGHIVGQILEQRDKLLRSLAFDHPFSLEAVSAQLRDSTADQYNLEIALVAAARAIGFVANHISGAGGADGLARFDDYVSGPKTIVLEAKSSRNVPSLGAIDFAGLAEHVKRYKADGCLLLSPAYPGGSREEDSAASTRAAMLHISCWTVDQLAKVVATAESRHITAQQILDIVLKAFSPDQVAAMVDKLLNEPTWEQRDLYRAVIDALRALDGRMPDSPRTLDMVAGEITREPPFRKTDKADIHEAISRLASASQGMLTYREFRIILHGSYDEIERRVRGLTGNTGDPRRLGTFRNGFATPSADE